MTPSLMLLVLVGLSTGEGATEVDRRVYALVPGRLDAFWPARRPE